MSLLEQVKHPVDEIFDFVKLYFYGFSDEEIQNAIIDHWRFGTIDAIYRDGKIIACTRWNISESGSVCDVLDLFINEGEDGVLLMKHLIARNWNRFPSVMFIRFARTRKYPGRLSHIYTIQQMLHLKESL